MEVTCSKCMAQKERGGLEGLKPGIAEILPGSVDWRVRCPICGHRWRASYPSIQRVYVHDLGYRARFIIAQDVLIMALVVYVMLRVVGWFWSDMAAG